DRVLRQRLDEADLVRNVDAGELLADKGLELDFAYRRAFAHRDERDRHFAQVRMRAADDAARAHRRMLREDSLDELRREVLSAADDHVLDASGDGEEAVGIEAPEVAAAQPAVPNRLLGSGADVAAHQARPGNADLTLAARGHFFR